MRTRLVASLVSGLMLAGGVAGLAASPAAASASGSSHISAGVSRLDGAQEVPGPGDPDGRGTFAYVAFDDSLCYLLTARRIDPAAAAHIHAGAVGVAGPIVIGLEAPTDGLSVDCIKAQPDSTAGDATMILTESELAAIKDNPAGFYANVHNAAFQLGAIRGQLN